MARGSDSEVQKEVLNFDLLSSLQKKKASNS